MKASADTPSYMRFDDGMYFVDDGWVTIEGSELGVSVDRLERDGFTECRGCRMARGALLSEEVVYQRPADGVGPGWALSRYHKGMHICRLCGIAEGIMTAGIDFRMARRAVATAYEEGRRREPGLNMFPYTGIPIFAKGDLYEKFRKEKV